MENCLSCKHYFITWDPKKPHGCRAMGFKSQQIPSIVVRQSSGGIACLKYKRKNEGKNNPDEH